MTKHFKRKVDVGLILETSVKEKHKVFFPSAILLAIVGILVTLIVASLPRRIVVALAAVVLVIVLVVVFSNKARYAAIMFLRQVHQRLAATKTYGDDKKPANRND
jgi:hydrogenase/urease accessory protein HupE